MLVADESGEITEVRTGPQVAWSMARGYDGAFGRADHAARRSGCRCAPLFLVAAAAVHRARGACCRWRTLDLLVLLSFGVSLIWFNRGEIFTSVPLQYPPMVYLAARLAWIAVARARGPRAGRGRPAEEAARRRRAAAAGLRRLAADLAAGDACWSSPLALRFGLNAFDSNVIDVGYAGVIGADRIAHGETPYGTMPSDCGDLRHLRPADLHLVRALRARPAVGGHVGLAARRARRRHPLRRPLHRGHVRAGLAHLRAAARASGSRSAWAAFPFTAFALETNSNDSLVAAALIWGLVLCAASRSGGGCCSGWRSASKFAPAVLLPLWSRRPFPRGRRRAARARSPTSPGSPAPSS